jgi:predicted AlkP superfamily pyrophosphatase or phosphodiesterase
MSRHIDIFMFVDALGWEIVKDLGFAEELLPHRCRVQMQFGYSSTAVPTILCGQPPVKHKHFSFFYYAPEKSPFKWFRYLMLHWLPSSLTDRWRVRHTLSKILAKLYGFTGYFEIYTMPFNRIFYFDYIEKNDIFVPGGLAPVPNLPDELIKRNLQYHISNWRKSEQENIDALIADIDRGEITFGFLYTAALDGLLHMHDRHATVIRQKLQWYEEQLERIVAAIKDKYDSFTLNVMSDHGMTPLAGVVDVKREVEKLDLKFGRDYVATYDSTLGRFWPLTDSAEEKILAVLETIPHSSIVSEEDKAKYGINFPDNMYGKNILLLDPGWQIMPCDMGKKALPGMHGFSPEDKESYASFMSNVEMEVTPEWVGDFFRLMLIRADKQKDASQ